MKTNKRGISLIVLAITIIVMIILATAIILSVSGKNVIATAKEATTASDMANVKHVVAVAKGEWELGEVEGHTTFESYAEAKLKEAGFKISGNGGINVSEKGAVTKIYQDKAGKTALVPEGYIASEVEGENTIDGGLVIYEGYEAVTDRNVKEAQETRNQFVWVPVPDISEFVRKDWEDGSYVSNSISYDLTNATETEEYAAMYNSVRENGGFYIARYEIGKAGNDTPVSQKNMNVWNEITFDDAKSKCEIFSTNSAVSHLIYGEEWDTTIEFILSSNPNYTDKNSVNGNFSGTVIKTGENQNYAVKNIFDITGNVQEWTLELAWNVREYVPVRRGDCYVISSGTVIYRNYGMIIVHKNTGFRAAMYLK